MTRPIDRNRQRADAIEDRHRHAAEAAILRHGRDQIADDLARDRAAGSPAFKDALRVSLAKSDRERPLRRLVVGVVIAVTAAVLLLVVAVIAWAAPPD